MSLEDIPNYRDAENRLESCDTCGAIRHSASTNRDYQRTHGNCTMYRANVERVKTCDSWYARAKKSYYVKRGAR